MELAPNVIAVVDGKPVTEVPKDLYIPPRALNVFLERFNGPLDLLLFLIRKQNFDIMQIPMAVITRQYIEYIKELDASNFDLSADYLYMASVLIDIKSRLLLPQIKNEDEEEVDPRAALAKRLIVYEKFKELTSKLDKLPRAGRDFFFVRSEQEPLIQVNPPMAEIADIKKALIKILQRNHNYKAHKVEYHTLSIKEKMIEILRFLKVEHELVINGPMMRELGRQKVVATFLAILELSKNDLVNIDQEDLYEPVHVVLKYKTDEERID